MVRWEKGGYVAGGRFFSATIGDTSASIIPSLTEPIEWRLETSIPGVSMLLQDIGAGEDEAIIEAANAALLEACNSRISTLQEALAELDLERDSTITRKDGVLKVLADLSPKAAKPADEKTTVDAQKAEGSRGKYATRKGRVVPTEDSPFHGTNLKKRRQELELTHREAAELIGVSESKLRSIENNTRSLSDEDIAWFTVAYSIRPERRKSS